MKLLVTKIEFDFNDEDFLEWQGLSLDEQISITNDNLGIWEVDNEDELVTICDKIIEELAPAVTITPSKVTITDDDYADKVDTLVGNMVASDDNVFTHDSEGC